MLGPTPTEAAKQSRIWRIEQLTMAIIFRQGSDNRELITSICQQCARMGQRDIEIASERALRIINAETQRNPH